jgi:hypothetical protein
VFECLSNPAGWPKPLKLRAPVEFKVELASPDQAVPYRGRVGVEVTGPRMVVSRGETAWQAWDQFWKQH